jgi:hypothetical protein
MSKLLLIFIIVTIPVLSDACSCISLSRPKIRDLEHYDYVFSGTAIKERKYIDTLEQDFGTEKVVFPIMSIVQYEYTFLVTNKFKGPFHSDTIKVVTGVGHGDCGFRFRVGSKYIVYSYYPNYRNRIVPENKRQLETNICTPTDFYSWIKVLRIKLYLNTKGLMRKLGLNQTVS